MRTTAVMMGFPSVGQVQAQTAMALWATARSGGVRLNGDFFELHLHPPAIGPYVRDNLVRLLGEFRDSSADLFLRIDSDMTWSPGWLRHFFKAVVERQMVKMAHERIPVICGGVYARRQEVQNYVPICVLHDHPFADEDVAEAFRGFYFSGATIPAKRLGGGFMAFNRACCDIAPEEFFGGLGVGEDYASCDAVIKNGGCVYGVWPKIRDAELGHITGGNDVKLISHYLTRWDLAKRTTPA